MQWLVQWHRHQCWVEYYKKIASPTDKLPCWCIQSVLQSKYVKLILTDHYQFFAMSAEAICSGWSGSMVLQSIIKKFTSSVKKYLWRAFAAGFQLLPFHAFYYNCPPVQYLALMQSNPYAQLLQWCKVFCYTFYIWLHKYGYPVTSWLFHVFG